MSAENGIFIPISDLKRIIENSPDLLEAQREALVDQLQESTSTPERQLTSVARMLGLHGDEEDLEETVGSIRSEVEDIAKAISNLETVLRIDRRSGFLSTRLESAARDVGDLKEELENFDKLERGLPAIVRAVITATTDSLTVIPLTPKQKIQLRFELNRLGVGFDDDKL